MTTGQISRIKLGAVVLIAFFGGSLLQAHYAPANTNPQHAVVKQAAKPAPYGKQWRIERTDPATGTVYLVSTTNPNLHTVRFAPDTPAKH